MAVRHDSLKFNYRDYCKIPDDLRVELIDGGFLMTPAPFVPHQRVSSNILERLHRWVREKKLGEVLGAPTDVLLSEHDVVQPDILFIAKERVGIVHEKNISGPPDLVIEILSPSTAARDQIVKKNLYASHGVKEYWIVDPKARSVSVFTLEKRKLLHRRTCASRNAVESTVVLGFKMAVKEIFE